MATPTAAARSAAAWRLARRQHGVLTRKDLIAHGSAAALWGIGPEWHLIEITVRRRSWPKSDGVKIRGRPSLPDHGVTTHRGIPVTTPARTILDQAATPISDAALERLVDETDAARGIDLDAGSLRRYCGLHPGEPGVRRLRGLLDPETFRLSDSELERRFRPLALAAGLPQPLTKVFVNGYEVDFYWPDLALVVEADSLRYHRNAIKQARDLRRDQVHTAAGLTALRFTHWQVVHEPQYVEGIVASMRLSAAPGYPGLRAETSRL